MTVHDFGYCAKHYYQVDFVSTRGWSSDQWSVMKGVCKKYPNKPVFNIAHGEYVAGPYIVFIGDDCTAEAYRERAYPCVFDGVIPTHDWQDTS